MIWNTCKFLPPGCYLMKQYLAFIPKRKQSRFINKNYTSRPESLHVVSIDSVASLCHQSGRALVRPLLRLSPLCSGQSRRDFCAPKTKQHDRQTSRQTQLQATKGFCSSKLPNLDRTLLSLLREGTSGAGAGTSSSSLLKEPRGMGIIRILFAVHSDTVQRFEEWFNKFIRRNIFTKLTDLLPDQTLYKIIG